MSSRYLALTMALLLCLASCPPTAIQGQELRIADPVTCEECRIELRLIATISPGLDDTITIAGTTRYAMDSHGHIIAGGLYEAGRIAMFDSSGQLIKTFGREGRGPGEFEDPLPLLIVDSADRLHVWESRRHSVIEPDLGGFVQLTLDPVSPVSAAFADSMLAVTTSTPVDGYVAHLISSGRVVGGLERISPETARLPYGRIRFLSVGPSGFWISRLNQFVVELWNFRGERVRRVTRSTDWFDEGVEYDPAVPLRKPPPTQIRDTAEDLDGRLWVLLDTAARDWQATRQRGEGPARSGRSKSAFFDSIIEILDLERGVVLSRLRSTGRLQPVPNPLGRILFYSTSEVPTGLYQTRIYEAVHIHTTGGDV